MNFLSSIRGLSLLCCFIAGTLGSGAVHALSLNDEADTYRKIWQEDLLKAYSRALGDAGESTTGNLYAFNIKGCSREETPGTLLYIHAVQDRGQPRGNEFPTYVFTSGTRQDKPDLAFKTYAGKRIYLSDTITCEPEQCLLSGKTGFSDVCLADPYGNPAPDLNGLRKDFWTDLMGWLGL